MKVNIITIFPKYFDEIFGTSIIGRAQKKGVLEINILDLRNFTIDKHKTVDKRPFGGGAGMILMIEPIYKALKSIQAIKGSQNKKILLTSPKGELFNQKKAIDFSNLEELTLICGHYEGVDHRVVEYLIDGEISIGNFILSGGELATAVIVDTISRLIPGSLGNPESLIEESIDNDGKLKKEYPQYTRPEKFITDEGESWNVPEILLSGHHKMMKEWKKNFIS